MANEEDDSTQTEEENPRPSLNDVVFAGVGMPEMITSRVIRGCILDEILTALLREGILTKDALSRALAKGEKDIERICQKVTSAPDASPMAAEIAETMRRRSAEISRSFREEFIDEQSQPSESK